MKHRILAFLFGVMLVAAGPPLWNLWRMPEPPTGVEPWSREHLYNRDSLSARASALLYPFGISLNPEKAIIGWNGWLYLGNLYSNVRDSYRRPPSPDMGGAASLVVDHVRAWQHWLERRHVKFLGVLIGPNKESVYPGRLPAWGRSTGPTLRTQFLDMLDPTLFFDSAPALWQARSKVSGPLFYATDTHWTGLGGSIALQAFLRFPLMANAGLNFPPMPVFGAEQPFPAGDLARFLRLEAELTDSAASVDFGPDVVSVRSLADHSEIYHGVIAPQFFCRTGPVEVLNPTGLNDKKLLWLRDSFGKAISPQIARMFRSHVEFYHHDMRKPGALEAVIAAYKPDYVMATIVERDLTNAFSRLPPAD